VAAINNKLQRTRARYHEALLHRIMEAVLTREDVEAYAAALATLGVEVIAMPVTRIEALDVELPPGPFAAVVIASRNAAAVLPAGTQHVWVVGAATKTALEQRGIAAIHPDGVHDGASLARALIAAQNVRGARVLVPRAEQGRTEAIELLRAAGADVVEVVAYRTHAVTVDDPTLRAGRAALERGALCCVFSPSQVAALAAIVPLSSLRCAAIGETTAAALRAAGVTPDVAASPTPDGLAQTVRAMLGPA
jgi:uroporphyrinogen-III synthase